MSNILTRIKRLFEAKTNEALDAVEGIEQIDSVIQEKRDAYEHCKLRTAEVIADRMKIEEKVKQYNKQIHDLQEKAKSLVKDNNDELACDVLKEKKSFEQVLEEYNKQLKTQKIAESSIKDNLRKIKNNIAAAERQKDILKAKYDTSKTVNTTKHILNDLTEGNSSDGDYSRIKENVESNIRFLDSQVSLDEELNSSKLKKELDKIDDENQDIQIKKELEELKKEVK